MFSLFNYQEFQKKKKILVSNVIKTNFVTLMRMNFFFSRIFCSFFIKQLCRYFTCLFIDLKSSLYNRKKTLYQIGKIVIFQFIISYFLFFIITHRTQKIQNRMKYHKYNIHVITLVKNCRHWTHSRLLFVFFHRHCLSFP